MGLFFGMYGHGRVSGWHGLRSGLMWVAGVMVAQTALVIRYGLGFRGSTMEKIDLRDSINFLSMLRACAAISALAPGACLAIVSNDDDLLPDLRRVHPECRYQPLPVFAGRPGDYAFGVEKTF